MHEIQMTPYYLADVCFYTRQFSAHGCTANKYFLKIYQCTVLLTVSTESQNMF